MQKFHVATVAEGLFEFIALMASFEHPNVVKLVGVNAGVDMRHVGVAGASAALIRGSLEFVL